LPHPSIYSLHPRMFIVSMLVNKTKTSVSLPFCPAASPSRLPCPHPHSSRSPPPPAKTGCIPYVPLALGRAFSLYTRRHSTLAVPSPIWNNKIFFRFDFTDFALPYEELFGAPGKGDCLVLRELQVCTPHFGSFLPGLGFLWHLLLFDDFVSIPNGGDYWDVQFSLCLEMHCCILHVLVSP
jgi:hypothetical protein